MSLLRFFIKHSECAYKVKNCDIFLGHVNYRKIRIAYLIGIEDGLAVIVFKDKIRKRYVCDVTLCGNLKKIDKHKLKNMTKEDRLSQYLDYIEFIRCLDVDFIPSRIVQTFDYNNETIVKFKFPKCVDNYKYNELLQYLDR